VTAGFEPGSAACPARRRRLTATAAAVAVLLAVFLLFLAVHHHNPQPFSGDEPHYLVIAYSLIDDGDVDVKNDYLLGRYHAYYAGALDPHVNTSIFTSASPHWYSQHGVGLPAVLVPAVAADGAQGATVEMIVIAVVVLLLTFLWVRRFTGEILFAVIATEALGLSPFFLGLQSRIFPDLPAAALLLGCLLLMEQPRRRGWQLLLLGALVGVSPWFHFKNALAFATAGAIVFVQVARATSGARRARSLSLLAAPALVSAAGYEVAVHTWYGSWLPMRMFPPGNSVFALSVTRGLAAASFDASRGLLTNNPALLLILAGLPVWLARHRGPFLRLALVVGPTILLQATFNDWGGGYAPGGRYALQYTPALVPAIALVLLEARGAFRAGAAALLGVNWALGAAFIWLRPSWGHGEPGAFLLAFRQRLGLDPARWMPVFEGPGKLVRGGWQLTVWIAVSCLLVMYGAGLSRGIVRHRAGPPA
jgi:hypothetical protein